MASCDSTVAAQAAHDPQGNRVQVAMALKSSFFKTYLYFLNFVEEKGYFKKKSILNFQN